MNVQKFDLNDLAEFLVRAKKQTYAGDGKEIEPQRPGFKELEFSEKDWNYRDSYTGYFCAPGQEIVRFQGSPIWSMSYDGGMHEEYQRDLNFARETFSFLKDALSNVSADRPFRGPHFTQKDNNKWRYTSTVQGDIRRFQGNEMIIFNKKEVFSQNFIGGLIIPKGGIEVK